MSEAGELFVSTAWESIDWAAVAGRAATGLARGAVFTLEVYAYDAAVASVTNDVYLVLSRSR